jgi:hypothetical protein
VGEFLHLNLTNGILPLALLVALTIVLPAILAGQTLSQRRLAAVMAVTLLVVWGVGAGLMGRLYAQINEGAVPGIWASLERSAVMGLLWGPVLALVWLMRAQGVERRRGLLMGRGGDETAD